MPTKKTTPRSHYVEEQAPRLNGDFVFESKAQADFFRRELASERIRSRSEAARVFLVTVTTAMRLDPQTLEDLYYTAVKYGDERPARLGGGAKHRPRTR